MSSNNLAANMKATASALVLSFNGKWTTEASLAPRAPECEHIMLPASLGVPKKNNAQWAARFENVKDIITEGTMSIDDYLAAPDERRAVCRSTFVGQTSVGEYRNEYIWFLDFDDTGEKITRIVEFVDTKAVADLRAKLVAAGRRTDQ